MESILRSVICIVAVIGAQVLAAPTPLAKSSLSPVVSPSWLLRNLKTPDLLVVDIRDSGLYNLSHVPGSLSIPFAYTSVWTRSVEGDTLSMPPKEELFSDLGANGFTTKKKVVLVTSTNEMPIGIVRATRVAATLQYAGFAKTQVGILDGGIEAWNRLKAPISKTPVTPIPAAYTGSVNTSFIVDRAYVHSNLNKLDEGIALVDARPITAYNDGHIESALSWPLASLWNVDGTYKPVADLQRIYDSIIRDAPVTAKDGEVIVYCWIGLMATGLHYTLNNVLGFNDVKLYDGSVEDWVKEYPLVTVKTGRNKLVDLFKRQVRAMLRESTSEEKAMPIVDDAVFSKTSTSASTQQRLGDAGPLGLSAFAFTTFVMALFNLSAGGGSVPNIIIGPALAYGGLGQLLAGMWDMAVGNTVGATIAASYGCFWISFAIILIPGFGIEAAYPNPAEFNHGLGFFMLGFFIFSLAVTMCSMKGTVPFLVLTILVNFTWLFLAIANLYTDDAGQPNTIFKKLGGAFGLLVSFTAWYLMYEGLANKSNSFVVPPQIPLRRRRSH
ncbi:hypothetical protein HJFPF1_05922 [Paramyrothecium foliicola]|nr:hypothetical protein HJFPF1_05922 [Paramyrothecium foliicola]